jgi:serine protease
MRTWIRFAPLAVVAAVPFLGASDCLGLCDYESDPNCEDPSRAQVEGTINVPQASNSSTFVRIDGQLAEDLKHQMSAALKTTTPTKIGRVSPPQSKNNAVAKAKTKTIRFRPGEIVVKGKQPLRFNKAEWSRMLEYWLGDNFMAVHVDVRLCGTDYRCLADVTRADGKQLDLAETEEAVLWADRAPFLEYAERNLILQIASQEPNDEFFTLQWHYAIMDLPAAWDITVGDPSRVAAVVDTGVLYDHPDFVNSDGSSRILGKGADLIDDPTVSLDGDGRDMDGYDAGDNECGDGCNSYHGTHVSGTIGAATNNGVDVAGVTWAGSILPVRVLGAGGGSLSDIADGIEWAVGRSVDGVSDNPNPADVINMSLGGSGQSQAMDDAVADAVSTGCIVVVAAGNDNVDATNSTPANSPDSIVVAAHGNKGGSVTQPRKASYSNFGPKVDIAAPGGEQDEDLDGDGNGDGVLSTLGKKDGTKVDFDVEYYQGTSMATPHVAGVAMLLKSLDNTLTQDQVRSILKQSALSDLTCPEGCGAGRLSAAAALLQQSQGSLDGEHVIASPSFLRVGKGQTTTPVVFENLGNQAATVTLDVGGANRDSCALDSQGGSVDAKGQIVTTVTITRNAAADDTGECTVIASTDLNATTSARVDWTADAIAPLEQVTVGPVQIDDKGGLHVIASRIVTTSKVENFQYKLFNLDPGTYLVVGLVDVNNNGSFDDPVDAVGIYTPPPKDGQPVCTTASCGQITLKAGDHLKNADFVVAPGFSPGSGNAPGTGSNGLGDACTDSTQCGGGLYCELSLQHGYCTTACASDNDCNNAGICETLQEQPPATGTFQICLKSCTQASDCRTSDGYTCDATDKTCFPG